MVGNELRILVVDDTEGYRELYKIWLGDDHAVETATNGYEALEALDERVDVVLLDRTMPGPSGTEVAHSIAGFDADPYVVMVSTLEPDFDIVEFPIDGYLQKPVTEGDVRGVLEQYRSEQAYRAALDEFFSLTAKLAAIESRTPDENLAHSDEYARLRDRVARKRAEVDRALEEDGDWESAFQCCTDEVRVRVKNPKT